MNLNAESLPTERTLTVSKVHRRPDLMKPECALSSGFCGLLKRKTLTHTDIECIKRLGFLVVTKEGVEL